MCRSSDSSYNLTNSSLITVGYQLRFLTLFCTRSADLARTWYYYVMLCNGISVFLWLLSITLLIATVLLASVTAISLILHSAEVLAPVVFTLCTHRYMDSAHGHFRMGAYAGYNFHMLV